MKNSITRILAVILMLSTCHSSSPNIVVILTDDQDLALSSLSYLTKINKLLVNKGTVFANAVRLIKIDVKSSILIIFTF